MGKTKEDFEHKEEIEKKDDQIYLKETIIKDLQATKCQASTNSIALGSSLRNH